MEWAGETDCVWLCEFDGKCAQLWFIPNSEQYETLKCVKEDRFYTCYLLFAFFYVGYFHRLDATVVT